MAFLLVLIGVIVGITALRNSQGDLAGLLQTDLTNTQLYAWAGAIIAIGLLGYIPRFETASRLLLGLVVLVLLISNNGVFAQFQQAFANPPQPSTPPQPVTTDLGPIPVKVTIAAAGSAASGIGGLLKGATDLFGGSSGASTAGSTAGAIGAGAL